MNKSGRLAEGQAWRHNLRRVNSFLLDKWGGLAKEGVPRVNIEMRNNRSSSGRKWSVYGVSCLNRNYSNISPDKLHCVYIYEEE